MINGALYRRGMKGSVKLLLILAAVAVFTRKDLHI